MAKIETYFDCDLKKAVQVQPLNGNVFSLDNNGNRIGIRIFDNGVKTTVTGTVTGRAILADNSTVNLNGGLTTVNGQSVAYVDVLQGALLIPGTIKITIQLTASGVITTLAAILSTVYQTKTDNVITPSAQVIADWNAEISSAIQTQNATIASAIATQDAQISDLKSALSEETNLSYLQENGHEILFINNLYIATNGSTVNTDGVTSSDWRSAIIPCKKDDAFYINCMGGSTPRAWCFIDSSKNVLKVKAAGNAIKETVIAPEDSAYLILNDSKSGLKSYQMKAGRKDDLESYKSEIIEPVFLESGKTVTASGSIVSDSGNDLYYFNVNKGDVLLCVPNGTGNRFAGIYDSTTSRTLKKRLLFVDDIEKQYLYVDFDGCIIFGRSKTKPNYIPSFYKYNGKEVFNYVVPATNWVTGFISTEQDTLGEVITTGAAGRYCSGFIPLQKTQVISVVSLGAPTSTTITCGGVFYNEGKEAISKIPDINDNYFSSGYTMIWRTVEVPPNAKYIRLTAPTMYHYPSINFAQFAYGILEKLQTLISNSNEGTVVKVAAANSNNEDKAESNIVCEGLDDAVTINNIISNLKDIGGGKIIFKKGRYILSSVNENNHCIEASMGTKQIVFESEIPNYNRNQSTGQEDNTGAQFYVSDTLYQSMESDEQYTVVYVSGEAWDGGFYWNGIGIIFPYNQKQIIGMDFKDFSGLCSVKRAYINAYNKTYQPSVSVGNPPALAAEGCIGIRTVCRNGLGVFGTYYEDCIVKGCYEGFAVNGEHTILNRCIGVFNVYSYTFGHYNVNVAQHPNMLIRCQDERGKNLPKFFSNPYKQATLIIALNIERKSGIVPGGGDVGDLAKEVTPGSFYGEVSYTINRNDSASEYNSVSQPFWTDGHGHGMKTTNLIHLSACDTETRLSYKPNFMEQIYDTTLNKAVICIDESVPTWVDMMGNAVDS